jgi:glutamate/tyrosine decarboxylase-like PLP-dependent enzyme
MFDIVPINEETLDPCDWESLRELSHRIVDDAIGYTRDVRDRPVWQPMPEDVRAVFDTQLPTKPTSMEEVYRKLAENMMPYPMGNIHPRFWMWYMGSSNFTGALGDFLAAILGSNLGGGNHAAALIDQQVVDWFKQMVGFPKGASGTLVSGGSMANFIGLTVARNEMAGIDVRENGVGAIEKPLRFYGSDQVHSCHQIAMETLGLGNRALRKIPTRRDCLMDVAALQTAIAEDRAAGFNPACLIATAGTVNTGAIDDLQGIAELCRTENMWFHVDGCIGALLAIAPNNSYRVAGLELADSIALDPHKWLHAPFEVGCALVRDLKAHRGAFGLTPEYLEPAERGIAAAPWLFDYGVQTSRGFRALKVWMSLQEHGVEKFGRLIDQNIAQATYLTGLIGGNPVLELRSDTSLNIVCYRYNPGNKSDAALKHINTEIMLRMQETGVAAVSDTTVHGEHFLRVAINNHRTITEDLEFLVKETVRLGDVLVEECMAG